jgi:hypothetical protein
MTTATLPRIAANGYRKVAVGRRHVLADKSGDAYAHRLALFDRIGFGPHRCHWCAAPCNWRQGLEPDHLDPTCRSCNDEELLVASCRRCNGARAHARTRIRNVSEGEGIDPTAAIARFDELCVLLAGLGDPLDDPTSDFRSVAETAFDQILMEVAT